MQSDFDKLTREEAYIIYQYRMLSRKGQQTIKAILEDLAAPELFGKRIIVRENAEAND